MFYILENRFNFYFHFQINIPVAVPQYRSIKATTILRGLREIGGTNLNQAR